MNPRRVWAVVRKEFIHILRDRRSLQAAIALPMLLLFLYGYAVTLDVDRVPMAVWDQSETPASRDLIAQFQGTRYFSVKTFARGYREIERVIDNGDALMALVVPADFAGDIDAGRKVPVQLIVDGSDSNTATIAMGYAELIALDYSRRIGVQKNLLVQGKLQEFPLDVRPRVWFNTDLESRNYLIPGLIAVIMSVIAALLTPLTISGEWEKGTMEQLISTPIKGPELILGKLFPYFFIGLLDVAISAGMGEYLFHVPFRGSVALLFAMASIFLVGAFSMGMLISIAARNQMMASQIAIVTTFLPSFLLSGFIFAVVNMPAPIQVLAHVVPATYFIVLLKGIYLKGIGLEVLALDAWLLAAFGLAMLVLANLKFKKKLE